MRAFYLREYISKTSRLVYVYTVEGTACELDDYRKAQGSYYREENGKPLFFTKNFHQAYDLSVTFDGAIITKPLNWSDEPAPVSGISDEDMLLLLL